MTYLITHIIFHSIILSTTIVPFVSELYPGAFEKFFHQPIYMYTVSSDQFNWDHRLMREELVSQQEVEVLDMEYLAHPLLRLKKLLKDRLVFKVPAVARA